MSEGQDASSSTSSSPEPPEPMDLEEIPETGGGATEDAGREADDDAEELDLTLVARQFAQYLVVDSKQDVSQIPLLLHQLYQLMCSPFYAAKI